MTERMNDANFSYQNVTDYRRTKGMLKTEIDFNERITTEGPS